MHDITITGLTLIADPQPNKAGATILANFDCRVGPFDLIGCALVRTTRNGFAAWPPKLNGFAPQARAVVIRDDSLRHDLVQRALDAYRALGGTDADWRPSPRLIGPSRPTNWQDLAAE